MFRRSIISKVLNLSVYNETLCVKAFYVVLTF